MDAAANRDARVRPRARVLLAAFASVAIAGCGDGSGMPDDASADRTEPGDGGGDAGLDAGGDATAGDAGRDAATDAGADAGVDLDCLGEALPTDAVDPLLLAGETISVEETGERYPLSDVQLELYKGGAAPTATTVSGDDGAFSFSAATGGDPFDGYIKATVSDASHKATYFYPPHPLFEDYDSARIALPSTFGPFGGHWGVIKRGYLDYDETTDGIAVVRVLDCAGRPIRGATVSAGGDEDAVAYTREGFTEPSMDVTATGADGRAFVYGPAGAYTLDATADGMTLRAHGIDLYVGEATVTTIVP